MNNRIKMSKKKKRIFLIVNIVLGVYVLSMAIGYAFFSEALTINGVASTVDYYSGDNIPMTLNVLNPSSNFYTTESNHKDYLDLEKETFDGTTLTVYYHKLFGIVIGTKTNVYTASFVNETVLDLTDGTASCEITSNTSGGVKSCSVTVSPTVVGPGESATIAFTITHNFLTRRNSDNVTATIHYNLQGQTKTFYFIVRFDQNVS